jgi:hypothetical protein
MSAKRRILSPPCDLVVFSFRYSADLFRKQLSRSSFLSPPLTSFTEVYALDLLKDDASTLETIPAIHPTAMPNGRMQTLIFKRLPTALLLKDD